MRGVYPKVMMDGDINSGAWSLALTHEIFQKVVV